MVEDEGISTYRAAELLDFPQSTAKAIMKKYRETGTIEAKKTELVDGNSNQS